MNMGTQCNTVTQYQEFSVLMCYSQNSFLVFKLEIKQKKTTTDWEKRFLQILHLRHYSTCTAGYCFNNSNTASSYTVGRHLTKTELAEKILCKQGFKCVFIRHFIFFFKTNSQDYDLLGKWKKVQSNTKTVAAITCMVRKITMVKQ